MKIDKLQRETHIEYLTSLWYHSSGSSRRSKVNAIHVFSRFAYARLTSLPLAPANPVRSLSTVYQRGNSYTTLLCA
jgi:hypothetical protein